MLSFQKKPLLVYYTFGSGNPTQKRCIKRTKFKILFTPVKLISDYTVIGFISFIFVRWWFPLHRFVAVIPSQFVSFRSVPSLIVQHHFVHFLLFVRGLIALASATLLVSFFSSLWDKNLSDNNYISLLPPPELKTGYRSTSPTTPAWHRYCLLADKQVAGKLSSPEDFSLSDDHADTIRKVFLIAVVLSAIASAPACLTGASANMFLQGFLEM